MRTRPGRVEVEDGSEAANPFSHVWRASVLTYLPLFFFGNSLVRHDELCM
jgi:hypothetical protein